MTDRTSKDESHERLSSGTVPPVGSGVDGSRDDAHRVAHMTLDFALKIADSHSSIEDVLEYRALAVLASAVRAAKIHTADQCSAHETKAKPINAPIEPEKVIADIDAGFARMPLRDEGVHWLHAWEWDAIKAHITHLRNDEDFLRSVRHLIVAARTTGQVAGRDDGLCAALDRVEGILEARRCIRGCGEVSGVRFHALGCPNSPEKTTCSVSGDEK